MKRRVLFSSKAPKMTQKKKKMLLVQQCGFVTYGVIILNLLFGLSIQLAHARPAYNPDVTGRGLAQPCSNKLSKSWTALADTISWDSAVIPALGHLPAPRPRIIQSATGNNNLGAEKEQPLNCCNLQANIQRKNRANVSLL